MNDLLAVSKHVEHTSASPVLSLAFKISQPVSPLLHLMIDLLLLRHKRLDQCSCESLCKSFRNDHAIYCRYSVENLVMPSFETR